MKLLKNILVGLGALFVLLIIAFVFLFTESKDFFKENKAFVETFAYDLTRKWNISDVHDRLSNELIVQLDSSEGKLTIKKLSTVGAIKKIYDIEMGDYNATMDGTTGVIIFKADFENAKGVVTVTLIKKDEEVRVHGFHLSAPNGIQQETLEYKA